jgi:multiple sugar transport system ATP-binding protein
MKEGVIQQFEHPTIVYDLPANQFVGGFIGNPPMNFLGGRIVGNGSAASIKAMIGDFEITPSAEMAPVLTPYAGDEIVVGIRAENMVAVNRPSDDALGVRVIVVEPLGSQNLLTVRIGDDTVKIATHPTFAVEADDDIWLRFPVDKIRWVDPASRKALYPELATA